MPVCDILLQLLLLLPTPPVTDTVISVSATQITATDAECRSIINNYCCSCCSQYSYLYRCYSYYNTHCMYCMVLLLLLRRALFSHQMFRRHLSIHEVSPPTPFLPKLVSHCAASVLAAEALYDARLSATLSKTPRSFGCYFDG